jgi:ribosome-binding protein aMBF1 (putative translation factor)
MPHVVFVWNDELIDYIGQHGVTPEEFEEVVVNAKSMTKPHKKANRVIRPLTLEETRRIAVARRETDAEREEILSEGRAEKRAWLAMRHTVEETVKRLRNERERLGLSLADVEERSGLRRSVLSRLENDSTSNPTVLTLQRYAIALGMSLETRLTSPS